MAIDGNVTEASSRRVIERVSPAKSTSPVSELSKTKLHYEDRHLPADYNIEDEVLSLISLRAPGKREKFLKQFVGPFRVVQELSRAMYKVMPAQPHLVHRSRSSDVLHISRMKPYYRQDS
ncbi:hypothetical protein HPB47_005688 [Ixodes persulcatus]|uniref:Uncharacterized protein n=1 Tax=Ixodes persulcatus TaxID=34615 RepID=A0AC60PCK3_IXOPE|nr:hypothetical protein HPB47_005688 [Ixodes persulcatus]